VEISGWMIMKEVVILSIHYFYPFVYKLCIFGWHPVISGS